MTSTVDWSKIESGTKFSCNIMIDKFKSKGEFYLEGIVYKEGERIYLFQNVLVGSFPNLKIPRDYNLKYSWALKSGSEQDLKYCSVNKIYNFKTENSNKKLLKYFLW